MKDDKKHPLAGGVLHERAMRGESFIYRYPHSELPKVMPGTGKQPARYAIDCLMKKDYKNKV